MDKFKWFFLRLIGRAGIDRGFKRHRYITDKCCFYHDCNDCRYDETVPGQMPCNACLSDKNCYFQPKEG